MNKILMIDDDKNFLKVYSEILQESGYEVVTAASGPDGIAKFRKEFFSIVILDILMPEMNGIEVLKKIKEEYPSMIVLMLTGEGSIESAVESMELGAYTYMQKPVDIENLLYNVKRAMELYKLNSENLHLKNRIELSGGEFELIGSSESIANIMNQIKKVAPTYSTVLITGESGTGKEIVANLLHRFSLNKDGPLIKVNCSALSESLLESELFGHEKGAFTGAVSTKQGRFELARGGTLFLDEIGEISSKLQVKLLRVLQDKEFERVGGTNTIHSEFRLICATNKNLVDEIEKGNFREDLYYRINVIPLETVPLRERREDIPVLLRHFIAYYCNEMNKPYVDIKDTAMEALMQYDWNGNVRELKNLAERLVVFSSGDPISLSMLPEEIRMKDSWEKDIFSMDFREAKWAFERKYLNSVLTKYNWNISKTADKIGIARKNLQLKIKQYDLKKDTSVT